MYRLLCNYNAIVSLSNIYVFLCLCIFKRIPKLQQEDQAIWWDTMCKMQKLFRKGAQSLFNSGKFDKDTMHNYFMSGT